MTKLIALVIIEHMESNSMTAWPSKSRLMALCSIKEERTVREHYRDALDAFFESEERSGKSNVLHIRIADAACEILELWKTPGKNHLGLTPGKNYPPVKNTPGNFYTRPPVKITPLSRKEVEELTTQEKTDNVGQEKVCETYDARGVIGLIDRLLEAGGEAMADTANAPGLIVMSEPLRWIENGCDLEADIIPTIRARCAKRKPRSISSWMFFTQAVAEAKARRTAPMEMPAPSQTPGTVRQTAAQDALDEQIKRDLAFYKARGPRRARQE